MDEKLQEDWLDARLRDEMPYVDDAGFTAQVMRRLPPPRPRRSFRAWILFCITVFGGAVTYVVSGGGKFIGVGVDRFAALPLGWIVGLTIICSLVFTSIATAAAFANVRENPLG